MDHVKKYPEDYSKPLLELFKLLAKANVKFFDKNESWFSRNWRSFYIIPFMVANFVSMSMPIVRELIAGRDIYGFLTLPMYTITIQAIFKVLILLSNKPQLERIIDELGQVWRTDNLNDKQKVVKKAKAKEIGIGVIAYLHFPFLVTWLYMLMPLVITVVFAVRGEHHEKRLPLIAEYPFDPSSSWLVYAVTYAYQFHCVQFISYLILGSDFMIIALSAHLSREFLLLREDLADIQPNRLARDHERILNFVRNHQKLIILAQELDSALNKLMFINVFFTTLNVCFFGLTALAIKGIVEKLTHIIIVITVLILMLILCYFGEKLKTASEEIFEAACENLWYEGDIQYQKSLCFIMMRSQKPCYLTSLSYTKITLQTFTKILSTTWSYFSLMNTMYLRGK